MPNKGWGVDNNSAKIEPSTIQLVKETSTSNSDGDYVKLNLRRDPTSIMSELYKFRMSLSDHSKSKELLLVLRKFLMNIAAAGTLESEAKDQYLQTLITY